MLVPSSQRTVYAAAAHVRSGFVLAAMVVLFCAAGARADIYDITFINVTFSATCIGGKGTCTEVLNGSALYDAVANTATGSISLTGSLNASLIYGIPPQCTAPGCLDLSGKVLYDPNALSGYNPIEVSPTLPTFDAPTPQPVGGGPDGTLLFVPRMCGGDQPACNTAGAFPGGPNADYQITSGTYTSVDVGPSPVPEPASWALVFCGLMALVTLRRRSLAANR